MSALLLGGHRVLARGPLKGSSKEDIGSRSYYAQNFWAHNVGISDYLGA